MKKIIFYILLNVLFISDAQSQILHQDRYVKIKGYMNKSDSTLLFQIENLSDSILILNAKNMNFENVRNNEWAVDLSLLSSMSLLTPSPAIMMNFIRLLPKEKYTAAAYNFVLKEVDSSFILYIHIDYMPIPLNVIIKDNVWYPDFYKHIMKNKMLVFSYSGKIGINPNNGGVNCIEYFERR